MVLSYFYGNPLIFAIPVIPIAALSAISAFFVGAGLIAAAGPATPPVCHFRGTSIKAMLLRNFVTLTVTITLCENILFYIISSWYIIPNALVVSVSMVTFIIATASIVGQLSGEIGQTLDKAEQALVHKNEELGEINEELMAVEEELRQNIDALTETERNQQESDGSSGRQRKLRSSAAGRRTHISITFCGPRGFTISSRLRGITGRALPKA